MSGKRLERLDEMAVDGHGVVGMEICRHSRGEGDGLCRSVISVGRTLVVVEGVKREHVWALGESLTVGVYVVGKLGSGSRTVQRPDVRVCHRSDKTLDRCSFLILSRGFCICWKGPRRLHARRDWGSPLPDDNIVFWVIFFPCPGHPLVKERCIEQGWFEVWVGDMLVCEAYPGPMLNPHGLYFPVWGKRSNLPVSRTDEMFIRLTMPRASAGVCELLPTRTLRTVITGAE